MYNDESYTVVGPKLFIVIPQLPVAFLAISVVFNQCLWTRYFYKIRIMAASVGVRQQPKENDTDNMKRNIRIFDVVAAIFIVQIITFLAVIIIKKENSTEAETDDESDDDDGDI